MGLHEKSWCHLSHSWWIWAVINLYEAFKCWSSFVHTIFAKNITCLNNKHAFDSMGMILCHNISATIRGHWSDTWILFHLLVGADCGNHIGLPHQNAWHYLLGYGAYQLQCFGALKNTEIKLRKYYLIV